MRFALTWRDGIVRNIRDVTPNVREFELMPIDGMMQTFPAGAHIDIEAHVEGQPQIRSYSLINEAGADHYKIAVKLSPESKGGSAYMWGLKKGARLRFTDPKTSFELEFGHSEYLLIAGGIGITPIYSMAKLLVARGRKLTMLYAVRSEKDLAFADELKASLGENLQIFLTEKGQRINFQEAFQALAPDALCAICGPIFMLDDAKRDWAKAKRASSNLRWETFGSSGRLPSSDFIVKLPRHNLEILVPRNKSLLDALEEAKIEVIYDCKKGECGLCAMPVLAIDGEVDHRDVFYSETQRHENHKICACVSRAVGTITLDTDYRPDAELR